METRGRITCECCGTTKNWRKLTLNKSLVSIMIKIYKWCRETGRHEFERKEIKHLLTSETESATFEDLIHFGGIMYRPEGKGRGFWGMNTGRAADFISGVNPVNTVTWIHPFDSSQNTHEDAKLVSEVAAGLTGPDGTPILEYGNPNQPIFGNQQWIRESKKRTK